MAKKTNTKINNKDYFRTTLHLGYDVDGKKIQKAFYGSTRKEAMEKKQAFLDSSPNGTTLTKSDTLGTSMYNWLFDIVILEIKPSSFERYEGFYRNYINDTHLSRLKLDKVTTQDVQKLYTHIYTTKNSATLVKNLHTFVGKYFNYQVKIGVLKESPCKNVVLPKVTDVKEKIEIFSEEEIQIFKTASNNNFDYFIFYFALATGMRQGEIIALTLDDIDLINNSINVNKTVNRVNVYENGEKHRKTLVYAPKSENSKRTIPLPTQIRDMVVKQIALQVEKGTDLLFTNQRNAMYDGDKLYDKYTRLLKREGIKHRKFHTLRHTYCSILARNNVPLKIAAELMGHDVEMTSKIYTHLNLDDKKNAIQNITF